MILVCRNSTDTAYFQRLRPYPRIMLLRYNTRFKDYVRCAVIQQILSIWCLLAWRYGLQARSGLTCLQACRDSAHTRAHAPAGASASAGRAVTAFFAVPCRTRHQLALVWLSSASPRHPAGAQSLPTGCGGLRSVCVKQTMPRRPLTTRLIEALQHCETELYAFRPEVAL